MMGGGAPERVVGIPNYFMTFNWRNMSYGAEAVIPMETGLLSLQTEVFQVEKNDQLLCKHIYLIEENRDNTSVWLTKYQHKLS